MNGRVYDPEIGRFMSVDPVFQFPENTQSLNPYSYVLNNPLSLTDPSGFKTDASDAVSKVHDRKDWRSLEAHSSNRSSSGSLSIAKRSSKSGNGHNERQSLRAVIGSSDGSEGNHMSRSQTSHPGKIIDFISYDGEIDGPIVAGNELKAPIEEAPDDAERLKILKESVQGLEKLDSLDSEFRKDAEKVLYDLVTDEHKHKLRLIWGIRTAEENKKLEEQGLAIPNSKHLPNPAKALDFIDRKIAYSDNRDLPYYKEVEDAAKRAGLESGNRWTKPWDPNHIEMKNDD